MSHLENNVHGTSNEFGMRKTLCKLLTAAGVLTLGMLIGAIGFQKYKDPSFFRAVNQAVTQDSSATNSCPTNRFDDRHTFRHGRMFD